MRIAAPSCRPVAVSSLTSPSLERSPARTRADAFETAAGHASRALLNGLSRFPTAGLYVAFVEPATVRAIARATGVPLEDPALIPQLTAVLASDRQIARFLDPKETRALAEALFHGTIAADALPEAAASGAAKTAARRTTRLVAATQSRGQSLRPEDAVCAVRATTVDGQPRVVVDAIFNRFLADGDGDVDAQKTLQARRIVDALARLLPDLAVIPVDVQFRAAVS